MPNKYTSYSLNTKARKAGSEPIIQFPIAFCGLQVLLHPHYLQQFGNNSRSGHRQLLLEPSMLRVGRARVPGRKLALQHDRRGVLQILW